MYAVCVSHIKAKSNKQNLSLPKKKKILCKNGSSWQQYLKQPLHLSIRKTKALNQKMLDLMSAFSKVAQYKIKIQKSVVLLYTYNEFSKKEIKKSIEHQKK